MAKKSSKPIYVISGKEKSMVNQAYQKLLDELIPKDQHQQGLFSMKTDEISAADLLDEVKTAGFLTKDKVVTVKDADKFISKNRESLEKYFDNPVNSSTLVFTVNSWPGNTKLAKKLPKVGKLISVSVPKGRGLASYLIDYTKNEYDKELSKAACELLVLLGADKPAFLTGEIDKLALYVGDRKKIEPADVEKLAGSNTMLNVFEVIDFMTAGKPDKAVSKLRKMFAEDKSAEYSAVGAFAYYFRKMFDAKVLLEKRMSSGQIAGKLRIWKNKREFFQAVGKLTLTQIGDYLCRLAEIDHDIKTGATRAPTAIEQLVFQMSLQSAG